MLRRDFETFFLGTAMTISRTGAPLACAKLGCAPKKATAALCRRGGPTSLAKTLQPRNNLAAAARFVPQGRQTGKRGPALLSSARPAALAGLGQHVFQLYSRPPRIGLGRQGQLFSDDLADIEQIGLQGLGSVDLGVQQRLAALRVAFLGEILFEDDAKGLIEVLDHWIEGQNAGLDDPAPQPALDHDLTARPAIHGHTGGKRRQAKKAETLGEGCPFAVAGDDLEGRATSPHSVQVDDPFDLGFMFVVRYLDHFPSTSG